MLAEVQCLGVLRASTVVRCRTPTLTAVPCPSLPISAGTCDDTASSQLTKLSVPALQCFGAPWRRIPSGVPVAYEGCQTLPT
jgi:hypothetical protein